VVRRNLESARIGGLRNERGLHVERKSALVSIFRPFRLAGPGRCAARGALMVKTILTVVITVIMVLFALNNSDHVTVHILVGKAVQIRLIFVLLLAGVVGFLLRHFVGVAREEELKRRLLLERKKRAKRSHAVNIDDTFDYDLEP
jgi:uncharacterized integral membrane protein